MSAASDLLAVARDLLAASSPTDAHLRRAVSTAYYALFRGLVTLAADTFVGQAAATRPAYRFFFRAYDHRRMLDACAAVEQLVMPASAQAFFGRRTFHPGLRTVAANFVTLQTARHLADYGAGVGFTAANTASYVAQAEQALAALDAAPEGDRTDFLAYLLAQPRR